MKLHYNETGATRNELVKTVAGITGGEVKYLGAPTFAYAIGTDFTVDKEGTLEFNEAEPGIDAEAIITALKEKGFTPQSGEPSEEQPEVVVSEPTEEESEEQTEPSGDEENTEETEEVLDNLTVGMPKDFFTKEVCENLKRIIESKGNLMKHAFQTDALPIEVDEDKVNFPWFKDVDAASAKAYTHFISAICDMAKNQKRITAKEKEVESEKYAFRCFLLRLGFNGAAYKDERKILLQNLSGPAAFPTQAAADAFADKQKAKKEETA